MLAICQDVMALQHGSMAICNDGKFEFAALGAKILELARS